MATKLNPYLTFGGNARAALEFYQSVFGGDLTAQTFKEAGVPQAPEREDQLMHGQLITTNGMTLMASDDPEGHDAQSASIAVSGEDKAELSKYWDALTQGAAIEAPFETAPWGDTFGMLTDAYGIRWMINVVTAQ